jgi:arylsulfatase A-like enzyme
MLAPATLADPAAPFGPRAAVAMAAWLGLVVGPFELAVTLTAKAVRDPAPLFFRANRHILWTIPLTDLALFLACGLALAALVRTRPRWAARASAGVLGGLALFVALITIRQLHMIACVTIAGAFAARLARRVRSDLAGFRRLAGRTGPVLAVGVFGLIGVSLGGHLLREPLAMAMVPPTPSNGPSAPNVLLVVLDTVRADRLTPYGYHRDTTPNLARLARRAVRFDQARSTAPWTLPSHASMMTGCWPHELSARLHSPLDGEEPTLAAFLAANGYATGGFVANTTYCGAETGLARGFARYDDHDLSPLGILSTTAFGQRVGRPALVQAGSWVGVGLTPDPRKDAAGATRAVLDWTGRVGRRPFFAFVNLVDAHSPYVTPPGAEHHFGVRPDSAADARTLDRWFTLDKSKLPPRDLELASDAYDNCLRYLDTQLGAFFDGMERAGLLENTLTIITADHGESFGEHGLFCHASSLYDPEVRVPLLVIPPRGRGQARGAGRTVSSPVSLRDLAATVADVVGLGRVSPFPGHSLAAHWDPSAKPDSDATPALAEAEGPAKSAPNLGRSPVFRGPMRAVASGSHVYIRNGDGREELFDVSADPAQADDLIGRAEAKPVLDRLRSELARLSGPPAAIRTTSRRP